LQDQFLAGAQANGVPLDLTETVFAQLQAFGGYSFAKSHAAAFAVLVYQSAWLKCYYPAAFLCALLNNQPMGFWSPAVLVGDTRRHEITVWPVDLDYSQARCNLEGNCIRLGFNYIDGLGQSGSARLVTTRQAGPFHDLADLCRRSRLPRRLVEQLILAGALDGWGLPRRQVLWALGQLTYRVEELPLDFPTEAVDLPPLSASETLAWERHVLGLPSGTGEHVMTFYRPWLVEQGILSSRDLARQPDGAAVRVAGLVVVHQSPPTAKGFHFLTLEDEAGLIDLILRPPVYARYRRVLQNEPVLIAEGAVQRQEEVTNLLVGRVIPLPRLPG
jgi:error-prone DNA polymerase